MYYSQRILSSQDNASDPDDEIDNLFSQLHQIDPPPWLIEHIMHSVTQPQQPASWLSELEGLVVRNDHLTAS